MTTPEQQPSEPQPPQPQPPQPRAPQAQPPQARAPQADAQQAHPHPAAVPPHVTGGLPAYDPYSGMPSGPLPQPGAVYGSAGQAPLAPGVFAPPPVGAYPGPVRRGTDAPRWLLVGAAVSGLLTYVMGFLAWVTFDESIAREAGRWGDRIDRDGEYGVPAYASYEMLFNPGHYFLILGAVAVATALLVFRRTATALQIVTTIAAFAWLGMVATAIALPPFMPTGIGAVLGLMTGFAQVALLVGALLVDARRAD